MAGVCYKEMIMLQLVPVSFCPSYVSGLRVLTWLTGVAFMWFDNNTI